MALRKARAVIGSSTEVEAAADDVLKKGNAVDAAVAGVLAACAMSPGVLLGPVQVLIGGTGVGLRALDGRVRQPGVGAPRPRGFQDDEEVPDAARVGVPWLPATLAATLAAAGSLSLSQAIAPALALAKGTGRADVFARLSARGARALEERPIASELFGVAGRPVSGLLTTDDIASPRPEVLAASRTAHGTKTLATLPWAHLDDGVPVPPAAGVEIGLARSVIAVDRNGTFAIACWEESTEGLTLGDLGLRAPFFAEPVRRGQTRVRPGDARPAAAPMALLVGPSGPEIAYAAFGAADAYDVLRDALAALLVDGRVEARGEARLVALAHAKGAASTFRS